MIIHFVIHKILRIVMLLVASLMQVKK